MIRKLSIFLVLTVALFSQSYNFEYLAKQLKSLATRDVTSGSQAIKWWDDYQDATISYNKALHWRGTMSGMEYCDEAAKWAAESQKREGDIKDMILMHLTAPLDPYSRTCFRIAGKQFTKPERLIFKVAAVGITVASGGALGGTVIKTFAPDIAHEVARTLNEEQIIDEKSKNYTDIFIDAGALAWNLKNMISAPDENVLVAEAGKLGLKVMNCAIDGNTCILTLTKNNQKQKVVFEFESARVVENTKFCITYPVNEQKNWNTKVKGTCALECEGYKVKIYIRTDKNYEQGEAIVDQYGKWRIDKTWPTKDAKNTIFAELYDKTDKKVATSDMVILNP